MMRMDSDCIYVLVLFINIDVELSKNTLMFGIDKYCRLILMFNINPSIVCNRLGKRQYQLQVSTP